MKIPACLITVLLMLASSVAAMPPERKDYPRFSNLEDKRVQQRNYSNVDANGLPLHMDGFRIFLSMFFSNGKASFKKAEYCGYKFSDLTVNATMSNGAMNFTEIKGTSLGRGSIDGFVKLDYNTKPATINIDFKFKDGLLSELFGTHIESAKTAQGLVYGRLRVVCSPFISGYVYGEGELDVRNGSFINMPYIVHSIDFMGIPRFKDVKFDEGHAKFILRKEGVYVSNLRLKSEKVSVYNGSGFLGFDRSLNLVMSVKTEMGLLGKIPGLGDAIKGMYNLMLRGAMKIRVDGTVDKPSVEILPFGIGKNATVYDGPTVKFDNPPVEPAKTETKK